MQTILAIDLGGTSMRAALVGRGGEIVALAARGQRIGDEAEAEPWWVTLGMLAGEVLEQAAGAAPVGIVAGGFTRSQVLVDAAGAPLRPAICFSDGRAVAQAAALDGVEAGTWTAMNAYHPLARLAWVRAQEPAVFAATRHVLQPKDWLAMRLTGRAACDRFANAWAMERRAPVRSLDLFRRAGFDPALLPDVLNPWDKVGRVRSLPPGAPEALRGLPVFAGGMDTWCASVGAGAGRASDAYLISGTTDAGGVLGEAPRAHPGLVSLPWGPGLFHVGGPSGAGADCLAWLAGIVGAEDAEGVSALAEAADPQAAPLLFLPLLAGARAPHWQPAARGGFLGLDRRHGPAELARAVLEGVAFADRELLAGDAFECLRLAGGGARSAFWCQLRADVLGRPVLRAAADEPGLVGAGLLGWVGLGVFPDLAAAQAGLAGGGRRFEPDSAAQARMDQRFRAWQRFQAAGMDLAAEAISA